MRQFCQTLGVYCARWPIALTSLWGAREEATQRGNEILVRVAPHSRHNMKEKYIWLVTLR